jgi:DNA-directed RNA polymerase specialized sigma24 family protein
VKGYYHDERSPETLSEREGRSVEAIYKTIQRARRDLQECIERQIRKTQA